MGSHSIPPKHFRMRVGEKFPVDGIVPLELTWVLTLFPQNSKDETFNQGLVCVHMHSIIQTQKILAFMT